MSYFEVVGYSVPKFLITAFSRKRIERPHRNIFELRAKCKMQNEKNVRDRGAEDDVAFYVGVSLLFFAKDE